VGGTGALPEATLRKEMQFEYAFAKAGGLLLAGPDPTSNGGVLPGFGDQRGIELLVEAGFSAVEAIQVATQNGARYLGQEDQIGTLVPGKRADVVLIKGDPVTSITDIKGAQCSYAAFWPRLSWPIIISPARARRSRRYSSRELEREVLG
jgi:hypothetical protein